MTAIKPNGHRTGLSRTLREHVRAHPGQTSSAIADALGLERKRIASTLGKMARQGHFTQTLVERASSREPKVSYTLAREPLRPQLTPEESAQRRKERRVAYDRKQTERKRLRRQEARGSLADERLPRVVPRPVAALVERTERETYEQFLARGGRSERIPTNPPAPYTRIPVRFAYRGAGAQG